MSSSSVPADKDSPGHRHFRSEAARFRGAFKRLSWLRETVQTRSLVLGRNSKPFSLLRLKAQTSAFNVVSSFFLARLFHV